MKKALTSMAIASLATGVGAGARDAVTMAGTWRAATPAATDLQVRLVASLAACESSDLGGAGILGTTVAAAADPGTYCHPSVPIQPLP